MRHYSADWCRRQKWQLGQQPKPFAGEWPTRLYWQLPNGNQYFGRPIREKVQQFLVGYRRSLDRLEMANLQLVELDRGGAVYIYSPLNGSEQGQLYQFYHHFQPVQQGAEHLLVKLHSKRIGGWNIYSPYSVLKKVYVDEFREWAAQMVAGKLKPPPRAKKKPAGAARPAVNIWGERIVRNPIVDDFRRAMQREQAGAQAPVFNALEVNEP